MKTILVPTDFSKAALNAVKYAFAYAEETNSKIVLFHTYIGPTGELTIPFSNVHYGKKEALLEAEVRIKKLAVSLLKHFPNAKLTCIVQPGIASDNIIEYVKQNKISLIIMGTTGQGVFTRALIGSTTSHVITDAKCTVIAVPSKAKYKGINKVAVATDLEKYNLLEASESVAFAKQFGAEVTFIHVQGLEIYNAKDKLQKMVDKVKQQMKYKNILFYVSDDFSVANGLDLFIKKYKPDVVTMVTYSRKFPETIWKTSWTNKMANHISVPLLILHVHALKPKKLVAVTPKLFVVNN